MDDLQIRNRRYLRLFKYLSLYLMTFLFLTMAATIIIWYTVVHPTLDRVKIAVGMALSFQLLQGLMFLGMYQAFKYSNKLVEKLRNRLDEEANTPI